MLTRLFSLFRSRRRMDSVNELHHFWRQPSPDGNSPQAYIAQVHRSRALAYIIRDLPKTAKILEVGCNVGRNLAYLRDQGYEQVSGVEINPHAVELLRKTYPQLADAKIHNAPAEEVLPALESKSFDLVFTMAVLEHVHPDSKAVFQHIARIGAELLCIEPTASSSHRQYPHDIPAIFKSLGCELVDKIPMSSLKDTAEDPAICKYTAWRFRCRSS
jgi:SAM-dependent methyltransferase